LVPLFYFVVQSIREKVKGVNFDKPQGAEAGCKPAAGCRSFDRIDRGSQD